MKNYKLKINGNEYNVDINEVEGQEIKLDVNGTSYVVTVDQEIKQQRKPVARPAAASQIAPAASGSVQKGNAPAAGNKHRQYAAHREQQSNDSFHLICDSSW